MQTNGLCHIASTEKLESQICVRGGDCLWRCVDEVLCLVTHEVIDFLMTFCNKVSSVRPRRVSTFFRSSSGSVTSESKHKTQMNNQIKVLVTKVEDVIKCAVDVH